MATMFVPLEEFSLETFKQVLDVNTTGSFLCAKYAVPLLKKTVQAGEQGVIVLVSSGAALGGSSSFAYGTSKGGVNTLGLLLANALGKEGIRVNVVMPGNIDTGMKRSVIEADLQRRGGSQDLERAVSEAGLGQPDGVARVLAWLVSDEAEYVKGIIATR
jgi:3-oxoacyl-[acyl-carrier protein] reductase